MTLGTRSIRAHESRIDCIMPEVEGSVFAISPLSFCSMFVLGQNSRMAFVALKPNEPIQLQELSLHLPHLCVACLSALSPRSVSCIPSPQLVRGYLSAYHAPRTQRQRSTNVGWSCQHVAFSQLRGMGKRACVSLSARLCIRGAYNGLQPNATEGGMACLCVGCARGLAS
jgi:hypothetical protein